MNMNKKTIKNVDLKGKKVFCRVDYNVPFDENMNITNDNRIQATVPTVTYLLEQGAAVILACHIGRPSEAAEAMEMGASAVLVNTAVATAGNPLQMAEAFRLAVQAGRAAYLAGPGRVLAGQASASSPLTGFLREEAV